MKDTIRTATIAAVLVFALGVMLSISDAVETTGEVVKGYSPAAQVQATATAQAIPLINEPTRTWIEEVVPTQQAVERDEIITTTKGKYSNKRAIDNAKAGFWIAVVQTGKFIISANIVIVGLSVIAVMICLVFRQVKLTTNYEPVQVVPEKALYFPQRKMLTHPATGLTWNVETCHPASIEHGTLLIEKRTGNKSVKYRFSPRNGERHPEVLDARRMIDG